jgi:hypothetical protein
MSAETLFTIVIPIVGIVLIFVAVIWREQLGGRQVIDFEAEKLGLVLKANALGLIVLLGFGMAASGIFLLTQQYEEKLRNLQNKYSGLEEELADLKVYDLNLNLVFGPDAPNIFKVLEKAYVEKKGENGAILDNSVKWHPGAGGIVVSFSKLNLGDTVHVEVEENGKKWRSDDWTMSSAQGELKMNPM